MSDSADEENLESDFRLSDMEPFLPFTDLHYIPVMYCLLGGGFVLSIGKWMPSETGKARLAQLLAGAMFFVYFWTMINEMRTGIWSLREGLPLHLCDISGVTIAYALVSRNKVAFELGYYWGLTGGINALLTPELEWLDIYYIPFFVWHTFLIIGPIYLSLVYGFRPTLKGIKRALGLVILMSPLVFMVNGITGANYMFLASKPIAGNITAAMPDWPFYIPFLGLAGAVYFVFLYLPYGLAETVKRFGFRPAENNLEASTTD